MTDLADDYTTWDAPYVLGALTRTERQEYEAHLASCTACQAAVAELAGLPGMLAMVDQDTALAMIEPPATLAAEADPAETGPQPPRLLPRLAAAAERRRRRGRWVTIAAAVASAAAAVAIAVPVVSTVTAADSPTAAAVFAQRQMDPLVPTPVQASFKLLANDGKATVELSCSYAAGGPDYNADFQMWMTLKDGRTAELAGWTAGPGDALTLTRTTEVAPERIQSVEIRSPQTGQTILRAAV
ncbi:zf-HC2 domain-containing protein [Nocardia brasiliensis]|uniref:Zf-HC2 domain-containing protein n=1 Tax=Nocardia brasiliensis TaxID=37326 RepID=A0A6G9Y104_NOCBR|nr:zf-HC2 domain-containing protein [Nocardia brasiliensis]QIS06882.1 zf-HC2 domain-containing protein [Nocardia brasiliensis]